MDVEISTGERASMLWGWRKDRKRSRSRLFTRALSDEEMKVCKESETRLQFYDEHLHKYQTTALLNYGYVLIKGTVLKDRRVLAHLCILAAVATVYALGVCETGKSHSYLGPVCLYKVPMTDGLLFSGLVSFLLTVMVNLYFNRWWTTRQALNVSMGRALDIAIQSIAYIRGTDEKAALLKSEMCRYALLALALVIKDTQGKKRIYDLVEAGHLTDDELPLLEERGQRWVKVYGWLSRIVANAAHENLLLCPEASINILQTSISVARSSAADVLMHINCQVPYAYLHIVAIIVRLHLLLMSVSCGTLIGIGIFENRKTMMIMGYAFLIFSCFAFEGLLEICDKLSYPFGHRTTDFPMGLYFKNTENNIRNMLEKKGEPKILSEFQQTFKSSDTLIDMEDHVQVKESKNSVGFV